MLLSFGFLKRPRLNQKSTGFTLIEAVIGVVVFIIIVISIYQTYIFLFNLVRNSRLKITAAALANEQFEIMRNLPYDDVGIAGGLPPGKIKQIQTFVRDNNEFIVKTTIRNIDDPFDGTLEGDPRDSSPADYKFAEIEVSCPSCKNFLPLYFDTYIGPKNLETTSLNGALFVRVFDANGQPVSNAEIQIENNQYNPPLVINDTTDKNGFLKIIDVPPGIEAYEIFVSKPGYSQEKTYSSNDPTNPHPLKPHATVVSQQLTQISFAIDKTSSLKITTSRETCAPVGNIEFSINGSKLIGTNPDVLKYSQNYSTNSTGVKDIDNMEWDTYHLSLTDSSYNLVGTIPLLPLNLTPDTNLNLRLIVAPKKPMALLVTVKDANTQLPLSNAEVILEKTDFYKSLITGRGFLKQTDWSGGAGQEEFIDSSKYFDSDGNIEIENPAGELRLKKTFEQYESKGTLISSTFDTGSESNFHQILWQPHDQPPETGPESIKFQIATNNDKTTWNFLGPDGTANTFYTLNKTNINPVHNGDRYLRYKVFLATNNPEFTPNLAEVAFTFTSSCVPPGQVIFENLEAGNYTLTVSKPGYDVSENAIEISQPWQQYEIFLNPSP